MVGEVQRFLRSTAGRMLLGILLLLAIISVGVGIFNVQVELAEYEEDKAEESLAALKLVEAFVTTYSELSTTAHPAAMPVPASFRAAAIERLGAGGDARRMRIDWLGVPGREIRNAPRDDSTRTAVLDAAQSHDVGPRTYWQESGEGWALRTVSPSVASKQSCVECHNRHLTGGEAWKLDDVMGAFVIDVPADGFLAASHAQGVTNALLVFALAGGAFSIAFWLQFKRHEADIRSVADAEAMRTAILQKDAAESANRSKSEFMALISHELRTPLNAINGFSELIANQSLGPAWDKYQDFAGDIHRSGQLLLRIVDDIIEAARAESGRLTLSESMFDLTDCLGACRRMVEGRAAEKGIALDARLQEGLWMWGDAAKVQQIALNLLTNAVKFTPAGGGVVLRASGGDDEPLRIVIEDTGIGIAACDIERAFQPFEQIAPQLTRAHEGTGLGLPMAKALTDLHGGRLDLTSVEGRGTRASVVFPAGRWVPQASREAAFAFRN